MRLFAILETYITHLTIRNGENLPSFLKINSKNYQHPASISIILSNFYCTNSLNLPEIMHMHLGLALKGISPLVSLMTQRMLGLMKVCIIWICKLVRRRMLFQKPVKTGDFQPIIGIKWQKQILHGGNNV